LVTLLDGLFQPIPLLLGANRDSFALFMVAVPGLNNLTSLSEANNIVTSFLDDSSLSAIRQSLGSRAASPAQVTAARAVLLEHYNTHFSADPRNMVLRAGSDYTFLCGTRRMAQGVSQYESQVYLYQFLHHPSLPFLPAWTGAYHFAEVAYVFGNANFSNWTSAE
jgi:carboxylesterase type B